MIERGATWDLPVKNYNSVIIKAWCEENLTPNTWHIGNVFMGVFEVCVGKETDVIAFKLRWL